MEMCHPSVNMLEFALFLCTLAPCYFSPETNLMQVPSPTVPHHIPGYIWQPPVEVDGVRIQFVAASREI